MAIPFTFALCADDYAMAPGVSRGILEALDAGALTATSAMTTSPDWPAAAQALRPFNGQADIGLHLNLTLGRPLGAMPRLAPGGTLPSVGTLIAAVRRGTLPLDELAAEIDRQLDAFAAEHAAPPDHVDGHQHVQVLAPVRRILVDALRRRSWTPWLRDSGDRPWRVLRRGAAPMKAGGVAILARGFASASRAAGLATNVGFAGFSSFDGARSYANDFAAYLTAPGPFHLVMCHPGYADDALRGLDPVVESRERELAFLLSPAFRATLERRGATLKRLSPTFTQGTA